MSNEPGPEAETPSARSQAEPAGQAAGKTIQIHYVKSNLFRVAYADGAWGGIAPSGRIVINFYNERAPIPLNQTHVVQEGGNLGPIVAEEGRKGILREVEVAVILDLGNAKQLHDWLGDKIKALESVILPRGRAGSK